VTNHVSPELDQFLHDFASQVPEPIRLSDREQLCIVASESSIGVHSIQEPAKITYLVNRRALVEWVRSSGADRRP
jgi:hypothetical protein